jgi:hypothetical protein
MGCVDDPHEVADKLESKAGQAGVCLSRDPAALATVDTRQDEFAVYLIRAI